MTYVLSFRDCRGNRHEREFSSYDVAEDVAKRYFLRPEFSQVIVYKRKTPRNPLTTMADGFPYLFSHSNPSAALPLLFLALLIAVPGDRQLDGVGYVGERVVLDLGLDVIHDLVVDVDCRPRLGCLGWCHYVTNY